MDKKPRKRANIITPVPTIIEFLLDETGSMNSHLSPTIEGFNDFVKEQKTSEICLMTLTKFDTRGLRTPYINLNVNVVPDLTTETFIPNSGTNLRDAINARISNLKENLSHWDVMPRVLFICLTDGDDNASHSSLSDTRQNIADAMEKDGWTFVYLGAHEGADRAARALGFPEGNIKCFSGAEMREAYHATSVATRAYRATVVAGTSSKSFYTNR